MCSLAPLPPKDQKTAETQSDIRGIPGSMDDPSFATLEAEDSKAEVLAQESGQARDIEHTLGSDLSDTYINEEAKAESDPAGRTNGVEEDNITVGEKDDKISTNVRCDQESGGDDHVLPKETKAADLEKQLVPNTKVNTAAPKAKAKNPNTLGDEHNDATIHKDSNIVGDISDELNEENVTAAQQPAADNALVIDDALVSIIYGFESDQLILPSQKILDSTEDIVRDDAHTAVGSSSRAPIRNSIAEQTREVSAASSSNSSVPPHLRAATQTLVQPQCGLRNSRHSDQAQISPRIQRTQHIEVPRIPRCHQPQFPHSYSRYDTGDREQVARLHAQVLSLKNVLDVERRDNANIRKTIEAEQQEKTNAAFSSLLSNLLRAQEEALASKSRADSTVRDLDHRTKKIGQMEVYLSEGQKQLFFQLDRGGIRLMSAVEREQIKREAELAVDERFADAHGKLQMRTERVGLRESAQELREQQYKVSIRAALEAEIRGNLQTVEDVVEMGKLEYTRGYAAGKEAGRKAAVKPEKKDNFIDGYAAYHRTQTALDNFRHGRIAQNDPDLAFLFDAGHPDNFVTRGMQMGRMTTSGLTAAAANGVARNGAANGAAYGEAHLTNGGVPKPSANGTANQAQAMTSGAEQGATPNSGTSNGQNGTYHDAPTTPTPPTPEPRVQERVRKMPPPRPTFAAELRGATPTHKGSYILANGSAFPASAPEPMAKTGPFADVGPDLLDL